MSGEKRPRRECLRLRDLCAPGSARPGVSPWFDRESRQGEIGIYIYNRDFQELRPASFAYEGMMDVAAKDLGLKRLCARILEDNAKSVHFHERMRFKFSPEDTGECVKNGERKRVLMYVKDL